MLDTYALKEHFGEFCVILDDQSEIYCKLIFERYTYFS
jgi:hypothetical protein